MQDPSTALAPRQAACLSVAEEVLRIARENDVPLRSDPALAEALATLDVRQQIPPELFRAVAEALAFVYQVNEKA